MAMVSRIGLQLQDMEFIQFHPTGKTKMMELNKWSFTFELFIIYNNII